MPTRIILRPASAVYRPVPDRTARFVGIEVAVRTLARATRNGRTAPWIGAANGGIAMRSARRQQPDRFSSRASWVSARRDG